MGIIICKKHGRQGIRLVCSDIRTQLESINPATQMVECHKVVDPEITELSHILCSVCLPKYAGEADFDKLPWEPACDVCFNENFVIVDSKVMPLLDKIGESQ